MLYKYLIYLYYLYYFNLISVMTLSHLIFTLGHIGLNMIIYAEKLESNLKKKNTDKDDKKNKKQKEEEGKINIQNL